MKKQLAAGAAGLPGEGKVLAASTGGLVAGQLPSAEGVEAEEPEDCD